MDCKKFIVNMDLFHKLSSLAYPCNFTWVSKPLAQTNIEHVYATSVDDVDITVKEVSVNSPEKKILRMIAGDILEKKAPMLFSFLYLDFVCENIAFLVTQSGKHSLYTVLTKFHLRLSDQWWAQVLYQIAKAVYYLEEKKINHNRLIPDTIFFQNVDNDPDKIALIITDFSFASPNFTLGRDLNVLFYLLSYNQFFSRFLPRNTLFLLQSLVTYNDTIERTPGENDYEYNRRRTHIKEPNLKTTGKYVSRLIADSFPFVTDRCTMSRIDKIFGTGFGAIVGTPSQEKSLTILSSDFSIENIDNSINNAWIIAVLNYYDYQDSKIITDILNVDGSTKDQQLTAFITIIIANVLRNGDLQNAIEIAIKLMVSYFDLQMINTIQSARDKEYESLQNQETNEDLITIILWCVQNTSNFEDAINKALYIKGNHVPIVGAIAGSLYGFKNIPDQWIKTIENIDSLKDRIAFFAFC